LSHRAIGQRGNRLSFIFLSTKVETLHIRALQQANQVFSRICLRRLASKLRESNTVDKQKTNFDRCCMEINLASGLASSFEKIPPVCQANSSQARIADSSSTKAVNFSSARTMNRFRRRDVRQQ
jgi:hypothetical protein